MNLHKTFQVNARELSTHVSAQEERLSDLQKEVMEINKELVEPTKTLRVLDTFQGITPITDKGSYYFGVPSEAGKFERFQKSVLLGSIPSMTLRDDLEIFYVNSIEDVIHTKHRNRSLSILLIRWISPLGIGGTLPLVSRPESIIEMKVAPSGHLTFDEILNEKKLRKSFPQVADFNEKFEETKTRGLQNFFHRIFMRNREKEESLERNKRRKRFSDPRVPSTFLKNNQSPFEI